MRLVQFIEKLIKEGYHLTIYYDNNIIFDTIINDNIEFKSTVKFLETKDLDGNDFICKVKRYKSVEEKKYPNYVVIDILNISQH